MNKMKINKINIGCGDDIREGWINLDYHNRYGANYIWDLRNLPLPFKDGEFDYVFCSHVLEDFVNVIPLLDELVRITKKGGKIELEVPYHTCGWNSIYHQRCFTVSSFKSYVYMNLYDKSPPVEIELIKFCGRKWVAWIYNFISNLRHKDKSNLIDHSFLKYLYPNLFLRVIYLKK